MNFLKTWIRVDASRKKGRSFQWINFYHWWVLHRSFFFHQKHTIPLDDNDDKTGLKWDTQTEYETVLFEWKSVELFFMQRIRLEWVRIEVKIFSIMSRWYYMITISDRKNMEVTMAQVPTMCCLFIPFIGSIDVINKIIQLMTLDKCTSALCTAFSPFDCINYMHVTPIGDALCCSARTV